MIITNLLTILLMIIIPSIIVYICSKTDHRIKELIAEVFGVNYQIYFGFLGIIIHELSHLIVALLFGHHITGVRLLMMPKNGVAGFVNHSYLKRSIIARLGNVFIGIAPVIGGSLSIYLIFEYVLDPNLQINTIYHVLSASNINSLIGVLKANIGMFFSRNALLWLMAILIIINITIGCFDLSDVDLSNTKIALIPMVIFLAILLLIAGYLGFSKTILTMTIFIAIKLISLFILPISIIIIIYIFIFLIAYVRN